MSDLYTLICPACRFGMQVAGDAYCPDCGTHMNDQGSRPLTSMQQMRLLGRGFRIRSGDADAFEHDRTIVSTLRLIAKIERLTKLLPSTAAANASRRVAKEERTKVARSLRRDGMTVRAIAERLGRTERHVYRLLEHDMSEETSARNFVGS